MKRLMIAMVLVAAIMPTASSVPVSAQQPNVPGMPTQARVVIINGRDSAIPVVVQPGGDVQPVTIVGTPAVTVSEDTAVWSRTLRQGWEYRTISVPSAQDPSAALNTAGIDGWEAVGVVGGATGNAQVLLKRPR